MTCETAASVRSDCQLTRYAPLRSVRRLARAILRFLRRGFILTPSVSCQSDPGRTGTQLNLGARTPSATLPSDVRAGSTVEFESRALRNQLGIYLDQSNE